MGLTSRRKRPLNRCIPHLRDTRLIIIATEGSTTEKSYFESQLFRNLRVQVCVLETKDNRSAPNHVLTRLRAFVRDKNLQPTDKLWLMVDKDMWPDKLLSEVCSHTIRGRHRVDLAISNPCFELWLYLHCAEWSGGAVTSGEMERVLRALLGSYNKTRLDIEKFRPGIDMAVQRARKLDTGLKGRWPTNPGTHVYKVVESIRELEG